MLEEREDPKLYIDLETATLEDIVHVISKRENMRYFIAVPDWIAYDNLSIDDMKNLIKFLKHLIIERLHGEIEYEQE